MHKGVVEREGLNVGALAVDHERHVFAGACYVGKRF
jgi:hypothetical protein